LLEKELKQNLSLKNVSVSRELFPFGLKVHINARTPIAYGEKILKDKKILGFIDKDGIFINKQNVDKNNLNKLTIQVFGWKEKFKKILSEIFIALENYEFEIVKITFSPDGFLTVEEKDLRTIFLGYKPNLINYQLQTINNIKNDRKFELDKKSKDIYIPFNEVYNNNSIALNQNKEGSLQLNSDNDNGYNSLDNQFIQALT